MDILPATASLATPEQQIATVDIVITVHNAIHYSKRCVDSVLEHTNVPFRIILVNDASDQVCSD